MTWRIDLSATATRQLKGIDKAESRRIKTFLRERLAPLDDPRGIGKALQGPLGQLWRYRVGDYRIICDIEDGALRVLVVTIGHRREVYR